ncbi:hypothetical protein FEV53_13455 [Palleronia caenipelagi]|uniref:Helix-turn-helix transcriptional regulator n=1 Tax=Palleronia caenipelagi TaxID=2489174 RepID=A0A547PS23_9RHOB|nr:hypothetical protein FEV53_13455 [Palleronia caenipelagi]
MERTFRNAFLEALSQTGDSLSSVSKGSGVSYEQLKKLKQRDTATTNVEDAIRIARHFGKTIDQFVNGDKADQDVELLSLLHQLQPEELQFLRNAARAQIESRDRSDR